MIAALVLVALWAFAEAILLFIVADVPIGFVALRCGWRKGIFAAVLAAMMAAFGGIVLILLVQSGATGLEQLIVALPAIDSAMMRNAANAFSEDGYWAMAKGSFSGIPYKLYANAAAPAPPGGIVTFFVASVFARLPRFIVVALAVSAIGHFLSYRIEMRGRLVILALAWTVFYSGYFAIMPA